MSNTITTGHRHLDNMVSNDSRNDVDFVPWQVPKNLEKDWTWPKKRQKILSVPNVLGRLFHTLGAEHFAQAEQIARVSYNFHEFTLPKL